MKPSLRHIVLAIGLLVALPACSRIDGISMEIKRRLYLRREKAFHDDMDRIARDTHQLYRLDYVLSNQWMPVMLDTRPHFRALQNGQFSMAPWLQENGIESNTTASAIFDPDKRTITIVDIGPNVGLIETMIEPLRPDRYYRVKSPSSPKP